MFAPLFTVPSKKPLLGCFLALLFSTVSYTPMSFAQSQCSALFKINKPFNATPIKEIDFFKTAEFEQLRRDFPGLKPVAEYDQTGVIVLHASSLSQDGSNYYRSLLRHLPADVRTLLVGTQNDFESFINYQYSHHVRRAKDGSDLDTFLQVQNETVPPGQQTADARWVKDHLGQLVTYNGWDGAPVTTMITSNYRYNYRISNQMAKFFGIQAGKNISGQHEWGNFTVIGDTGYMIHGSRTHSDLRIQDFMATGVRKLVLLPQPELDGVKQGIPHVDEFLIPLSKDHIATNVPEFVEYFQKQGKSVELLPSNADLIHAEMNLSHLTYTNAVLVSGKDKKVLFVPQFGKLTTQDGLFGSRLDRSTISKLKQRDKEALAVYRKMAEALNITVVAVDVARFTFYNFGGIHCATGVCGVMPTAEKMPSWYKRGDTSL